MLEGVSWESWPQSQPISLRLLVQVVATFRNGRYDLKPTGTCNDQLQEFIGRFSISLLLRFGFSFISVTDLYQESLHAADDFIIILHACAGCDYIRFDN